jgi:hypothetical protein
MHSDAMLIQYKLLNTKTTTSGVQARWVRPDAPVETQTNDSGEMQSLTLVMSVYYETTDTA